MLAIVSKYQEELNLAMTHEHKVVDEYAKVYAEMSGRSSTHQFPSRKPGGHGRTKSDPLGESSLHIATTWPSCPRPALIKLLLMWQGRRPSTSHPNREP